MFLKLMIIEANNKLTITLSSIHYNNLNQTKTNIDLK